MAKYKYLIEGEVCPDSDSNCSWEVSTEGNCPEDLRDSASVSKVDQDGGEVCTLSYADAPGYVQRDIDAMIDQEIEREAEMRTARREYYADLKTDSAIQESKIDRMYAQADTLRKQAKGE